MPVSSEPWGHGGEIPKKGFDPMSAPGSRRDLVFDLVSHTIGEDFALVSIFPGQIGARILKGLPELGAETRSISVYDVCLADTIGILSFCIDEESMVMAFPAVATEDFSSVISSCSGMGIGCLALEKVGAVLRVANDVNEKILLGHNRTHTASPRDSGST